MTITAEPSAVELLPGYYIEHLTGAWLTLPWPGDPLLPYDHPDRLELLPPSLGPQVIAWCERYLVHHLTGTPWRFTPGQKRFLHLWYAIDPVTGRWLYRSAVKRGAKGTGKDPFGAAMVCAEFAGPVRLVGWDGNVPRGGAHRMSLVQIAANSEAQAADLLRVANAMLGQGIRRDLGIDTGATRTVKSDGSRIELLTASEKSAEGDPATAIFLNESHHMTETSGGHKVADVARRNVAKSPAYIAARLVELTNAHQQGSDSVAERSFEAWQTQVAPDDGTGRRRRQDILYDSREAPPDVELHDDDDLMRGLRAAYGDSPWSDLERLRDEAQDTRTSVADSIRYYLNGLAAAEDAWIDPARFDACARGDLMVGDGERVAMFLDCSKSTDATGLVAARIDDGHVITLGVWQRPRGLDKKKLWRAPRAEVDAQVREAFEKYRVVWFGVDPSPATDDDSEALYWADLLEGWHRDYHRRLKVWATPGEKIGHSVRFDMRMSQPGGAERNRAFTEAAERTALDIDGEVDEDGRVVVPATLTHDGHPSLRTHAHNAKGRPNQWGVTLGKVTRDSSKLVDLAVCMVGARLGRSIYRSSKPGRRARAGGRSRAGLVLD